MKKIADEYKKRLNEIRCNDLLGIYELADAIGISYPTLYSLMSTDVVPRLATLKKIRSYLERYDRA